MTPQEGQLPELQTIDKPYAREKQASFLQDDNETSSSVIDAPGLPHQFIKTGFLTDSSGNGGELPQCLDKVPLFHSAHFGVDNSSTEGGDEMDSNKPPTPFSREQPGPSGTDTNLRDLSGRSRGILKRYFEETPPFALPIAHPTVAFSEPQLYHLLRVLTDETISMSFSTMERLVIDAVKGTPTVNQSRTDHFRTRDRNQRSTSRGQLDSSEEDSGAEPNTEPRPTTSQEIRLMDKITTRNLTVLQRWP